MLCGRRGDYTGDFCLDCEALIYRNNDRVQYVKILRRVLELPNIPGYLRRDIEEKLKHVPPFEADKD